jgi:tetratricopeptide (TPR) repeat protein
MPWLRMIRAFGLTAFVAAAAVAAAQTSTAPAAKASTPAREERTPQEDLEPKDLKPAARQLIDRAKAAHTRRNYDEAAALAEKAIAIDPRAPTAYYILYTVQALVKRNDEVAIRTLQAGAQACPDAPSVHYNLGNVYSSRMQHREAAEAFRKALNVARTPRPLFMASTNYNLGNELLRSGDKSAAIEAWREALVHNPLHHQARRNIVVTYYEMTAYASAREEARKLQQADPSGPAGAWAAEALRRMENPIPAGALQPRSR